MSLQKQPIHRSDAWKAAVRSLECCVLCGRYGVEVAHRNEGKGIGIKADDCMSAALCRACHNEIDNGRDMDRDQRRERLDRAILATIVQLARRGLIGAR